jgi:hypothetical protein
MDRKEAIKEYKARKAPPCGVCALRCGPTGQVWVGNSRNLESLRNRLWFTLRLGGHSNAELQAAWNAHGEQAFAYEMIETLAEDVSPLQIDDLLKEKTRLWLERLGARPLVA